MKYAKMLGLLAIAAAALLAFVGTASATELTSPKGTKLGVGSVIKSQSAGATTLDGSINVTCQKSTVEGSITNAGGSGATVSGPISSLTFTECGNNTVTVTELGSLEIHSLGGNTGTLTSTGARVTVLTHSLFLGTEHCIYVTNNTHIGTFTGSDHNGHTTATLHIDSAPIPEAITGPFCGNDAEWTGTYEVTSPDHLYID